MRKIHENSVTAYEHNQTHQFSTITDQVFALLEQGNYTAKELCELCGDVPTATMSGILRRFKREGVIVEIGKKPCPITGLPNSILSLRKNLTTIQRDAIETRIMDKAQ